ncbi:MAG: mannosyltransferase family protein [Candidatus Levyibacteriota bacterium]
MKKFWQTNKSTFIFISVLFIVWRVFLLLPEFFGRFIVQHPGYNGPIPWANTDGIHYLHIATNGSDFYEQAFFPLFPLLIRYISQVLHLNVLSASLVLVYTSLFIGLFLFAKLASLDISKSAIKWALIFFLFFPTGFFFVSVYTESLFLLLCFASFYAMRKKQFFIASVFAGLASATRVAGIFLLPAIVIEYFLGKKRKFTIQSFLSAIGLSIISSSGLLMYMHYLFLKYKDPLLFFHVQPGFGAQRSGSSFILLPQVLVRYAKILLTIPYTNHDFWVALLELSTFSLCIILLVIFYKKVRFSYLVFSLLAILVPTLTGTLSSEPRYVLAGFPVFIILGNIKSFSKKVVTLILFILLLIISTLFFLRGYFIA